MERKSRHTLIGLAQNKEAREVTLRHLEALAGQRERVETMTFDHGKEFALHERLADLLDTKPTSPIPITLEREVSTQTPATSSGNTSPEEVALTN